MVHRSSFIGLLFLLFLALRVPLLVTRAPFFDELFTCWIAGRSFAGILSALRYDSGPPLYYFIVHAIGDPGIVATRGLSLVSVAISLVLILRSSHGVAAARGAPAASPAFLAAALLAIFPPAVLLAADARAYAICAMCLTLAVLAIDGDRPFAGALALVLAAYSHYYGVLFFPILLVNAAVPAAGQPAGRRRYVQAFALAILLYIPGFWLALHQPAEARAWMTSAWPDALFVKPPLALAIIGGLVLAASVRVNRYMLMVLVPLALALALRVYVPMRFEGVIAAPLALWLAESLRNNRFRVPLITALIAVGVTWSALGIIDHANRAPDPYRQAALWVSGHYPG